MNNIKYKLNYVHDSLATHSESTCNFWETGTSGGKSVPSWRSCSVNNLSTNSITAVVTDGWVCVRSRRFIIYGSGVRPLLPSACFARSTKYLKWDSYLKNLQFLLQLYYCNVDFWVKPYNDGHYAMYGPLIAHMLLSSVHCVVLNSFYGTYVLGSSWNLKPSINKGLNTAFFFNVSFSHDTAPHSKMTEELERILKERVAV